MINIDTNKIDNKNILIVKMDKLMLSKVSQIASITLGSSFVNEDILDNDINLCVKIDEVIVAYATTKFIDLDYLKKIIRDKKLQLDQEYEKIGYRPPLHKGTKCDIRFKSSLNSARLNLLNPYK